MSTIIDRIKRFFGCKHTRIRCIHGDEIILAGWRRSACLDCPQLFDSLPAICTVTNEPHKHKKKISDKR